MLYLGSQIFPSAKMARPRCGGTLAVSPSRARSKSQNGEESDIPPTEKGSRSPKTPSCVDKTQPPSHSPHGHLFR